MKVDLHSHSTASDGVLSPAELVKRAHSQGVKLLALTDHDTLAGIEQARTAAQELGMHLVNGVELSCLWGGATIHVLGFDFSMENKVLTELIDELYDARLLRSEEIAQRLSKAGFADTLAGAKEVQKQLGEVQTPPARPHFAEFMVQAGYVKSHSEAFKKWLGTGKIGDIKQHWPTLEQVMHALTEAQAWISLAHPYQYDFTRSKRRRLISDFVELGGHALEVSNGLQPAEHVGALSILAREFSLSVSAGSDFHAPHQFSEVGLYRTPATDLEYLWHKFALPADLQLATGV
ncbi:PHP domain-containing protein [Thiopseudomonas acetoxidans]|uniref:PHP domain-containing protein n=1 Tax=Thiopseudomonas acetoxidans TaxID=3041622 RepID=A0ABT7SMP7_9GAMM|nr:PHP domain-containing protein [Thiopseudomonas sp. CY1220]MDM7857452.1 PHP domain-containing protein [Thiopseudomonas sp. CY1220]NLC08510.1 PHP domain-containing protein [Gammaproteobacteria bacterium]